MRELSWIYLMRQMRLLGADERISRQSAGIKGMPLKMRRPVTLLCSYEYWGAPRTPACRSSKSVNRVLKTTRKSGKDRR